MPTAITSLRLSVDQQSTTGGSSRERRRAYVSPDVLRTHKIPAGSWVVLSAGSGARYAVLQLWPRASCKIDVVCASSARMDVPSGSNIDIYAFEPVTSTRGILRGVTLKRSGAGVSAEEPSISTREKEWIMSSLKEDLACSKYLFKGYTVRLTPLSGKEEEYTVVDVEVSTKAQNKATATASASVSAAVAGLADGVSNLAIAVGPNDDFEIYEMDWRTKIHLILSENGQDGQAGSTKGDRAGESKSDSNKSVIPSYVNLYTPSTGSSSTSHYSRLGGLKPQIALIRSLLELPLTHPESFALFNMAPPKGVLLYGPPGTGKTALARAVASSTPQCSCIVINGPELSSSFHGETEERLRAVFDEARKRSPCVIVLDEVDALCPRRDGDGGEVEKRVVATLLTLMDGMGQGKERVFVIGATNRPNGIDPALRRPGRFDREIEIGIPDAIGRKEIIDITLQPMPHTLTPLDIQKLADRTHGFVGADLVSLIRESCSAAIQRFHTSSIPSGSSPILTNDDILSILPTIRPSTMREVFVETPSVRWTDIGGQEEIKRKLKECVEWPLTHRDTFKRLGVEAPRGVLLYGPPGCSKTMTAKALATESGLNFIAVKGPELLNKYVGESERAVREIFRKARAASPSIIFFDEIDAVGSSRSEGDSPQNGVLTSLLNEMDGIEELSNVIVVGATNRPDVLDSALMRPGRLDRILYVDAPDQAARHEIFRIRFQVMSIEPNVDITPLAEVTEGCSGAEIISICQDAALSSMNEDPDAAFVKGSHLMDSARSVRRRITPEMIAFYEGWRDQSGVRSA